MTVHSAGILLFRRDACQGADGDCGIEVLLAHPGGPFFARKDEGAWSIPKGEFDPGREDALSAALREFAEETGAELDGPPFVELGSVLQRKGKIVHAFAFEGEFDVQTLVSNTFELEWPPHSGRMQVVPEIDRAAWYGVAEARLKVHAKQQVFIDRLLEVLHADSRPAVDR